MRWDNLFDDLEGQLERELSAEETDVQAEEERLRLARLSLRERVIALRKAEGGEKPLRLALVNGESVSVVPSAFGRDWFSADLVDGTDRSTRCIVPFAAITSISISITRVPPSLEPPRNLSATARLRAPREAGSESLSARLGLPFVLRDLCRRRAAVEVVTTAGRHHGTIDRVGRDHFDLAEHERGVPRHARAVENCRIVPMAQLALVLL